MQPISRRDSSSSFVQSATNTPSTSPQTTFLEDRLNALLAHFDQGTHAFCREDRTSAAEFAMATKLSQATAAAAAAQKQTVIQPQSDRRPLLSLLSMSRPGQTHFDPSRDPKLHGLL